MAAQLILIAKDAQQGAGEKENRSTGKEIAEEKKASGSAESGEQPGQPRRFPRHRRIPIGVLSVFGQEPEDIGHYANVDELLDAARSYTTSPSRSNTIFGSVGTLKGLDDKHRLQSVHGRLEGLSNELTIIVHEEKHRA